MRTQGLSERRALSIVQMSPSSLRYVAAPDRNAELRRRIVALAQRHHRYGSGMIYLKLRQSGEIVNHKRVERLYAAEKLQIKRRRRKKGTGSGTSATASSNGSQRGLVDGFHI